MATTKHLAQATNRMLDRVGLEVRRKDSIGRTWDNQFRQWVAEAEAAGVDPNDIGDVRWESDEMDRALQLHYLPALREGAVVLELGPGSGRLTRHLVKHAQRVIACDRSNYVVQWMREYLPKVETHHISEARLPLGDASVDACFAHGVIEHLVTDETYWFLADFARVLRPGGVAIFNFNNLATPGGLEHLRSTSSPVLRSGFQFYTPEAISSLAKAVGFTSVAFDDSETRTAFATLLR